MRLDFRGTRVRLLTGVDAISENYVVSVLDSDRDQVLADTPIRAADWAAAWNDAVVIALRACRGSGAVPMTITVVRAQTPGIAD